MQKAIQSAPTESFALSLLLLCLFTSGCSSGPSASAPMAGSQLRGSVHGGQQPVTGSSIQLYAAGTSGYGAGATALLSAPVTTDSSGSFTISGQYTCPSASSQLYIVATGGNPGLGTPTNNSSLALMAALGPCSLHNNQYTLDPSAFININEVTTVASVFALAGFMDPTSSQIGASATNAVGMANAFQTVLNLANITSGQALATTPNGNGTVPQAKINTLADILSPCVNSTGDGQDCASLFAAATPSGGTAPTNTLQAAINIATQPAQQVATLFALSPPTPPFQPTLAAAPNDWTLTLNFTGGSSTASALAVDASGNVWIVNSGSNPGTSSVTEYGNNGALLSGSTGFTGGGMSFSDGIAIDQAGNVWVNGHGNNNLVKLSSNGTILSGPSGYTAPGMYFPRDTAIDGAGNAWVTAYGSGTTPAVFKFATDGTLLSGAQGFTAGGMNTPTTVAIDPSGNVWITNYTDYNVTELSASGQVLSGSTGYTGGGLSSGPRQVAIDADGNAWILNASGNLTKLSSSGSPLSGANGFATCTQPPTPPPSSIFGCNAVAIDSTLAIDGGGNVWAPFSYAIYSLPSNTSTFYFGFAKISNSGTLLSGATGYATGTALSPVSIGIDSSGNIWGVLAGTGIVEELIGAATPVVTPLSIGVKNATLGTRP